MVDFPKKFAFENEEYEIRRRYTSDEREYRVYRDGKPVNPYVYSVPIHEAEPSDETLIYLAEMDIRDRVWESRLAALRELRPRN